MVAAHFIDRAAYREITIRIVTILLVVVLAVALASTYFGHSSSPYGVCYGTTGRSIPCEIAHSERAAQRPPAAR